MLSATPYGVLCDLPFSESRYKRLILEMFSTSRNMKTVYFNFICLFLNTKLLLVLTLLFPDDFIYLTVMLPSLSILILIFSFLFSVLFCVQESLASNYALSARQCKAAVEKIGKVLNSKDSESLYKGTFVSPR